MKNWFAGLIDPFQRADTPPPRSLVAFFRWGFAGAWRMLAVAALVSLLVGSFEVLSAFLLGQVIDSALSAGPGQFWAQNTGLVVLFVLFYLVLRPVGLGLSGALSSAMMQPNLPVLILSRLHRYVLGHSVTFFDNDFAGRLAQKEVQTAGSTTEVLNESINALFYGLASALGAIWLVGDVSIWGAVVVVVWIGAYFAVLRYFLPRLRVRAKARANARAAMTGQIVDTITNIKTVKLFAHARHEDEVALDAMEDFRARMIDVGWLNATFRFTLMIVAGTLPVTLVLMMVSLWQTGAATAGDIAATGALAIRLSQMTGWISFTLMQIYSHVGEAEDGMTTLTPAHTLVDRSNASELSVTEGEVRFDDVTFGYGSEKGGIHGVSLRIAPGEKLGIVGASGAGKSTLVNVLMRLYDVDRGAVLIDGQDIAGVTQESLRRAIGMVTQETAMFNRTARANILYGRPEAAEADVLTAADQAEAHAFIGDLVDFQGREGYDAYLGERGVKLSGGQRQRIALARALLKDAPILVLDEATSALDSEVEASIQSALEHAMQGKTVLAIAHRLSTLQDMDRIIVLDQGRIVEEGSHSALLAQDGLYARYWNRQSGGFIGTDEDN